MTPECKCRFLADRVRAVADKLMDQALEHAEVGATLTADDETALADELRAALEEVGEHP